MSVDGHTEYCNLEHALLVLEPKYGSRAEIVFLVHALQRRLVLAEQVIEEQEEELRAFHENRRPRRLAWPPASQEGNEK